MCQLWALYVLIKRVFLHLYLEIAQFLLRLMLSDRCPVCLSVTLAYCGQTVGRIKMKLGLQVVLGPGLIVLDADPAPSPPKGRSPPQFSAHIYCGQMAAWVKMPLGKEAGLGLATLC